MPYSLLHEVTQYKYIPTNNIMSTNNQSSSGHGRTGNSSRERSAGGHGERREHRGRGGRGGRGDNSSRVLVNQSSSSPSAILGRRATQERVIVELELEVEALRDKCNTYQEVIAELRTDISKLMIRGCTKKSILKSMRLSEVDERYSQAISKL